ncbi:transposase [Bradyrhizobium ivorense]|uniref:transposase n=1 Tax=Bradyrhizobium ivorense TaxID=2511166 RepID=UPI001E2CA12D|nr:transposase [Bradyrhizobium ivorense]
MQTSAGEVNLKTAKLRRHTFETAIIERYRRRESSVEEALIEMSSGRGHHRGPVGHVRQPEHDEAPLGW